MVANEMNDSELTQMLTIFMREIFFSFDINKNHLQCTMLTTNTLVILIFTWVYILLHIFGIYIIHVRYINTKITPKLYFTLFLSLPMFWNPIVFCHLWSDCNIVSDESESNKLRAALSVMLGIKTNNIQMTETSTISHKKHL
jgi:hypothetical protein